MYWFVALSTPLHSMVKSSLSLSLMNDQCIQYLIKSQQAIAVVTKNVGHVSFWISVVAVISGMAWGAYSCIYKFDLYLFVTIFFNHCYFFNSYLDFELLTTFCFFFVCISSCLQILVFTSKLCLLLQIYSKGEIRVD